MKSKKPITGTMVVRWIGILTMVVVSISFIITALRSDAAILDIFEENWTWLIGGLLAGAMPFAVTDKENNEKK